MTKDLESKFIRTNRALLQWRQGDYYLGDLDFYFQINPSNHIASDYAPDPDEIVLPHQVSGLCVVSQSCDILRECQQRPYIEVSPLVKVPPEILQEVKKGARSNYGFIPQLEKQETVIDLDRVMTIEKSCLIEIERQQGCNSDQERRNLSKILARKRARFAFPDDFNNSINKLIKRIKKKHGKNSNDGEELRSLREIRVTAYPSWQETPAEVHISFIKNDSSTTFDESTFLPRWIELIEKNDMYNITGEITSLEKISAKEYIESDPLDFDNLTVSSDLKS